MFVRSARPTRRIGSAVAALLAILAAAAPAARADTSPRFQLGAVSCEYGALKMYPPVWMMPVYNVNATNAEGVAWQPVLRRRVWRFGHWRWKTVERGPTYTAATYINSSGGASFVQTPYGQAWSNTTTGQQLLFYRFDIVRAGVYRVRNWLYWNQLDEWFYTGSPKCRYS